MFASYFFALLSLFVLIYLKRTHPFIRPNDIITTFASDYHGVLRNRLRLYPSNLTQAMLPQGLDRLRIFSRIQGPYSMAL